jgi:hypothetical protein
MRRRGRGSRGAAPLRRTPLRVEPRESCRVCHRTDDYYRRPAHAGEIAARPERLEFVPEVCDPPQAMIVVIVIKVERDDE